jgi:hypothetical protein
VPLKRSLKQQISEIYLHWLDKTLALEISWGGSFDTIVQSTSCMRQYNISLKIRDSLCDCTLNFISTRTRPARCGGRAEERVKLLIIY